MDKPWLLSLNHFSWDVNPICNIFQSCKHVKDRESLYIDPYLQKDIGNLTASHPMNGEFSLVPTSTCKQTKQKK